MIKHFCDKCETEMIDKNKIVGGKTGTHLSASTPFSATSDAVLNVEVLVGLNGVWETGTFCKYCVIDLLTTLDDRPKLVNLSSIK